METGREGHKQVTWDNLITLNFTRCLESICKSNDALKILCLYIYPEQ